MPLSSGPEVTPALPFKNEPVGIGNQETFTSRYGRDEDEFYNSLYSGYEDDMARSSLGCDLFGTVLNQP